MVIGRYCPSPCRDCRVEVYLMGDNKEICCIITPAIYTILLAYFSVYIGFVWFFCFDFLCCVFLGVWGYSKGVGSPRVRYLDRARVIA